MSGNLEIWVKSPCSEILYYIASLEVRVGLCHHTVASLLGEKETVCSLIEADNQRKLLGNEDLFISSSEKLK